MKTKLAKITALLVVALMLFGAIACSATINDPKQISIGKVGKANLTLADYLGFYQNNYYAMNSVPDYNAYIKEMTVNYGVALNRCYELGLTLDDEDQKELQTRVDEMIDSSFTSAGITGDDRDAKLKELDKVLKKNGTNLKKYTKEIKDDLTKTMLLEKLRDEVNDEVVCGKDEVKDYFNTNIIQSEEKYKENINSFASDYNNYITGKSMIPLTNPEDMFTVKHILIKYDNSDSISDTVEGTFTDEQIKKITEIEDALKGGITLEEFAEKYLLNKDYNDDPVFQPAEQNEGEEPETIETNPRLGYREHGYIMNENLIDAYYKGFGEAACILYYGEDWTVPTPTPDPEATAAPETTAPETTAPETTAPETAAPETAAPETTAPETAAPDEDNEDDKPLTEKYDMKFFRTGDGVDVVEVRTKTAGGGVHFIFIAEKLKAGRIAETGDALVEDENSEAFKSIQKFHLETLQSKHYEEEAKKWKEDAKIKMISDSTLTSYLQTYMQGGN